MRSKQAPLFGAVVLLLGLGGPCRDARAQIQTPPGRGFEIGRYQATSPGEGTFVVDQPWYSSTRRLAVGLTLDYAHSPLVLAARTLPNDPAPPRATIEHRLSWHFEFAASFFDRLLVLFALPVVLAEGGEMSRGVAPLDGVRVSDPQLGARVRLFGQPGRQPLSLSAGLDLWIPIYFQRDDTSPAQVGETGVRILPKLMLGGLWRNLMWSVTLGFLYRPVQWIGDTPPNTGNTVGSEIQLGAALRCTGFSNRFTIGPEVLLTTVVIGQDSFPALGLDFSSAEILLGAQYHIASLVQLGIAGGIAGGHLPGTPDGRVLFRLAYAPRRTP